MTINLHLGDSLEAMKAMPDKCYDLAIVDPPYGINWMEQIKNPNEGKKWKSYPVKDWDSEPPSKDYLNELFRVSKNQIIWGANYFISNIDNSNTPCWVIWDKCQEFSGAVFEMAWTSFKSPAKAFRMSRVEAYCNQIKIHPTQKPVALYQWCLEKYAKPGDRILDTHLGSGSIAIACHDMKYDLDGWELDPDYFAAAKARLETHQQQQQLFTGIA